MDGWESRRRRDLSVDHDWMAFALGAPAIIHELNLCTHHFTGNYPPHAAVDALAPGAGDDAWQEIIPKTDLAPDSDHWLPLAEDARGPWQRLRVRIYPDGGLARIRVHGAFVNGSKPGDRLDLAAMLSGARTIDYSDAHFGAPDNMLLPGDALNMGDGWETARRRGPGNDWAVVELGCAGIPEEIKIATEHFKGNYPASCRVLAAKADASDAGTIVEESAGWPALLDSTELGPDATFTAKLKSGEPVSHLRLEIFPDGGISRLRLVGTAAR